MPASWEFPAGKRLGCLMQPIRPAPWLARISHHGHGLRRPQAFDPQGAGRKAYRGIRLRPATPQAGAWGRPEGRRSPADSVRRSACPMHHIALRASPTLSAGERRADHDHGEKCGLGGEPAWPRGLDRSQLTGAAQSVVLPHPVLQVSPVGEFARSGPRGAEGASVPETLRHQGPRGDATLESRRCARRAASPTG